MVANITRGNNFYAVANYNQTKIDEGKAQVIDKHNMLGNTPNQIDKYLNKLSEGANTKNKVFHVSLNFHETDKVKLNDENLIQISSEYMENMGYGKQPYIVYRHEDTAHPHIHILSSRVDIHTQKRIEQDFERIKSQRITQELERKYGLTIANQKADKGVKQYANISNKEVGRISEEVNDALRYAPTTLKELNRRMDKMGATYRVRSTGKGHVFYRADEQGKRVTKPWKGSVFKAEGLDSKSLKKVFEQNYKDRQIIKKAVQNSFNNSNKNNPKLHLVELEQALMQQQIGIKYAHNDKGIYGMSYEYNAKEFKASDIDKSLSWNQIQKRVNGVEDVAFRERLKASLVTGEPIGLNFYDNQYHISHSDKTLVQQLKKQPNYDGVELGKLHNKLQKKIKANSYTTSNVNKRTTPLVDSQFNHRQIIRSLSNEVDNYLQRRYEREKRERENDYDMER